MKKKQIDAILSDYDGTLCSATSVRNGVGPVGTIPKELEQILFHISEHIPVCIISSKDFRFLHSRTRFAKILSCVLGLETVNHSPHHNNAENNTIGCVGNQHLIASNHSIMDNSKLLHKISETLRNQNYTDIIIEESIPLIRKF
jgi:trehalose-6-phosphatase